MTERTPFVLMLPRAIRCPDCGAEHFAAECPMCKLAQLEPSELADPIVYCGEVGRRARFERLPLVGDRLDPKRVRRALRRLGEGGPK